MREEMVGFVNVGAGSMMVEDRSRKVSEGLGKVSLRRSRRADSKVGFEEKGGVGRGEIEMGSDWNVRVRSLPSSASVRGETKGEEGNGERWERQVEEEEEKKEEEVGVKRGSGHLCSACGRQGHNMRRCPVKSSNYQQRCGGCGGVGHNIRTCALATLSVTSPASGVRTCQVCKGTGSLICKTCSGKGSKSREFSSDKEVPLVELIRARARERLRVQRRMLLDNGNWKAYEGTPALPNNIIMGGERCATCSGTGLLTCMSCGHLK
mmetsp:Transcript_2380/g.4117  ORF Transcript_2380/g.4117 Transcript_2380/m.4117 type:complete len:265 (+) Transcript_2380:18-812(+)